MMRFSETPPPAPPPPPPPPPLHQISSSLFSSNLISMNRSKEIQRSSSTRAWHGSFPTSELIGTATTTTFGDTNCMEQLLVHCANAIQSKDITLAQQILWVLNNIAPPDGDSNQRLASGFLHALISRAANTGMISYKMLMTSMPSPRNNNYNTTHKFCAVDLASYVGLTPWYCFGFTAANSAIIDAIEGYSTVHIVDLSLTHCMQIPTLVDSIATRFTNEAPLLKLTVVGPTDIPPLLDLCYDELGSKLVNFSRSRNVVMEFRVVSSSYKDGFASLLNHLNILQHLANNHNVHEALIINCHMMLHYVPEETLYMNNNAFVHHPLQYSSSNSSHRSIFLKAIQSLNPTMVILVDEDADLTSNNLACRLRSSFNYLWIPYDTVDTFLPRGSKQRQWYEASICWKIENLIAHEGVERVERVEAKSKWVQRMKSANFKSISFGEDTVSEVKSMLDEHAAGWGLKKEVDHDDLMLTWKGHNVVFASIWVPI